MSKVNVMTITQVAERIGVVPKTILRWEKAGKIARAKRDWRGWRVYTPREFKQIDSYFSTLY